jgi:hypothetical protein
MWCCVFLGILLSILYEFISFPLHRHWNVSLTHQVEAVVDKIIEKARTGEIGDGKIFCKCVEPMLFDLPQQAF